MNEVWYLWNDETPHSPYYNMAMDEVLYGSAPEIGRVLIHLAVNDRPAMSIGCNQKFPEKEDPKLNIVRRATNGGSVYYSDVFFYTMIIPPGHSLALLEKSNCSRVLAEAILPMTARMGESRPHLKMEPGLALPSAKKNFFEIAERFDVLDESGRKIAGAVQQRSRDGILSQGFLLRMPHTTHEAFIESLLKHLERYFECSCAPYLPNESMRRSAERLGAEKYRSRSWSYDAKY